MAEHKCRLLIVDDEEHILRTLSRLLEREFEVYAAGGADQAMAVFARHPIELILCDQKMPGTTGVQLLEWVQRHHAKTLRLLMTGYADLEDMVEAINRGHVYRFLFKPWKTEELLEILRDAAREFILQQSHEQLLQELRLLNEQLELRVQQRTIELEEANRQLQQKNSMLERLALTDDLTGLPNRRAIEQILSAELRRRSRYPTPLAVGLVDVDHFKDVNTRFLYPGGDQVLIGIAKVLNSSIRGADTAARVGGEEFLVVAPETDIEGANALAERIRTAVEQARIRYLQHEIRVTVSAGFAVANDHIAVDSDQMIHHSAAALGEAKSLGRNRSVVWPLDVETLSRAVTKKEGDHRSGLPLHVRTL